MAIQQKINLHSHTTFCDGKNSPEGMVLAAIKNGFTVFGFSGHCFFPHDIDLDWHIKADKFAEYTQEIRRLEEKYKDQIKIIHGFEVEYAKDISIPEKSHLQQFNPDYLIGSVHYIYKDGKNFTVDEGADGVKAGIENIYHGDAKSFVLDYFANQREMLQKGKFEIWGHPDLIRKRNGVLNFFSEEESWYKDALKETVKVAAGAGVVAEINTGAIGRKVMQDTYPSDYFLSLIHEAGIPVCVNSDTHSTDSLDSGYDYAYLKAKKAGYTELIYPFCGTTLSVPLN